MPRTRGRAVNREAPADHVSAPEAAQLLKVHPDSIRNWLLAKPPKIAGRVVTNTDTNRTEYWVMVHGDSEAPTLEEELAERSQVATRGDLATSEENVLSLIERNLRVAVPKLDELGSKIDRQRTELRGGQEEILGVVRGIADSMRRQADALEKIANSEERELAELSTLNRWLETLNSGAQRDRDDANMDRQSLAIIVREFREFMAESRVQRTLTAAPEEEKEEKRRPWYVRWFQ